MENILNFEQFNESLSDKSNKEFVCKIGTSTIYYSNKKALKDVDKFIIMKGGYQVYFSEYLDNAISHIMGNKKPSRSQLNKWLELGKKFDPSSVRKMKKWLPEEEETNK